ncbi:hypothetical protein ACXR2U_15725 [Jatrophihabitans sp. YIM 134969]
MTGPGALLGVVTLAVSGAGWGLLLADGPSGDHIGVTMGLGFGAFVGAAIVATLWAWTTRPGGITARYAAITRLRRGDSTAATGHALGWPPRELWLLPLPLTVLLALTAPVAYALEPGDHSIWGGIAVYGLLVPYGALLAWSLVWAMVVLPLFSLGRIAWLLVRRKPIPDNDQAMLVLALILLPILLGSVGIVLGTPDGTKGDQAAAFFGAGDQSSPWLWVARGSIAFLVVTVLGAFLYFTRVARTRGTRSRSSRRGTAASPATPARGD